jgi:membrane protease YdiL (CAAX protease family)
MGLVSALVTPILDPLLQKALFGWRTAWFPLNLDFASMACREVTLTLIVSLICMRWIAPVVEELYFRGFLLPRLSRLGTWAPVLNGVLFTLYHFFSFWSFVERVIMIVLMAWPARMKRSLLISIIAHLPVNTVEVSPPLIATLIK